MQKHAIAARLRQQLEAVKSERQFAKSDPATLAARVALKNYQSQRLAVTHHDLLSAQDTGPAAEFFLAELYGAQDLTQRDQDVTRIVPTLERLLPLSALEAIADAVTLDALSERMDAAIAAKLGVAFNDAEYISAYRELSSQSERRQQLSLVQDLGLALCELVRIPLLAATLTMMRGPAKLANLQNIQRFLERGFCTFKAMRDPHQFIETIIARESAISAQIYAGELTSFARKL